MGGTGGGGGGGGAPVCCMGGTNGTWGVGVGRPVVRLMTEEFIGGNGGDWLNWSWGDGVYTRLRRLPDDTVDHTSNNNIIIIE